MRPSIVLLALFLAMPAAPEDPPRIKVYCFSADLEAGFKDKYASYFCKRLGELGEKKGSLRLAEPEETPVVIEFLERKTVETKGESTYIVGGFAWTPDELEHGVRAVLRIGEFAKGFHATGFQDQALNRLWSKIEEWIRENRETILKKAAEKE